MVDEQDLASWRAALAEQPTGWDVRALTGCHEQEPPWSWRTLVENLAPMSGRVLDLGTGGGEVLSSLTDVLPGRTHATEGWAPNLPIARARLEPLGIQVHEHDAERAGSRLPFPAESFDLVLSRHEAYDAADVARVLAPGGALLTQQVGGDDLQEIRAAFGLEPPFPEVTLENFVHELHRCGLTVQRSDAFHGTYEFDDVAALLAYLCRSPWDAPADLDVDRHRPQLEALEEERAGGPLTATASRFLILARAPGHPDVGRTDFATIAREYLEVPRV